MIRKKKDKNNEKINEIIKEFEEDIKEIGGNIPQVFKILSKGKRLEEVKCSAIIAYMEIIKNFYRNNEKKSEKFYMKVIEIFKSIETEKANLFNRAIYSYLQLADINLNKDNYTEAISFCNEAEKNCNQLIKLNPKILFSYERLVHIYMKKVSIEKDQKKIEKLLKDSIALLEEKIEEEKIESSNERNKEYMSSAENTLGLIYEKLGDLSLNKIKTDVTSDDENYKTSKSYFKKAKKNYEITKNLNNKNPDIYNNLGIVNSKLAYYSYAVANFKTAIRLNKSNKIYFYNLGETLRESLKAKKIEAKNKN